MQSHLGSFTSQDWLQHIATQAQPWIPYADPAMATLPAPSAQSLPIGNPSPVPQVIIQQAPQNWLLWGAIGLGMVAFMRSGGPTPTKRRGKRRSTRRPARRRVSARRKTSRRRRR